MSDLLVCEGLSKKYSNNIIALNNLNLRIGRGEIVGLLGPNGSGKTTLIKLINDCLVPTAGNITIDNHPVGVHSKEVISYLPDVLSLDDSMRVDELINFYKDFYYKDFDITKAKDMIKDLGIDGRERYRSLSKGTKEKVQISLVMSRSAKLYVLDEPIGGVDPAAREYLLRTILTNYNEDATILLSTHLISDIENIMDRVIFLKQGKVEMNSTVDEIRGKYGKSVDALFREVFKC
ncbi:MAG: ABC transporter ATP-binding protein [Suipraeoptans sp.]